MSFLSVKDFADHVGVKPPTLRKHISRGKVIKKNNLIDTDHPVNKNYIDEYGKNLKTQVPVKPTKKAANEEIEYTTKAQIPSAPSPSEPGSDETNLTIRKKRADALKAEREAEYKHLQIQKLQGKLMPIDLVEKTQTINIQSVFRSFESSGENLASIMVERLGGDRADLAFIITRMREDLQRAINSAKQKSKEEITALMQEYAATRSRGEKK